MNAYVKELSLHQNISLSSIIVCFSSGGLASGRMWLWMIGSPLTIVGWSSCTRQKTMSSGPPSWRKLMPSEKRIYIILPCFLNRHLLILSNSLIFFWSCSNLSSALNIMWSRTIFLILIIPLFTLIHAQLILMHCAHTKTSPLFSCTVDMPGHKWFIVIHFSPYIL